MSHEVRPDARPEAALPFAKLLIDYGPLVAFFLTYYFAERLQPEAGIYWATGVLAYFDAQGQDAVPEGAPHPVSTREALKSYDPGLFALVNETVR